MISKRFSAYIFITLIVLLFYSCKHSKIILPKDNFIEINEATADMVMKMTMSRTRPVMIKWTPGKIESMNVFDRKGRWKKEMDFRPAYAEIKAKEDGRIISVEPAFMQKLVFSGDSTLCAATMKLGTSMNSSVGVFDLKKKELKYTIVIDRAAPSKEKRRIIGLKETYFAPEISKDNKYLICRSLDTFGKKSIHVVDLKSREGYSIKGGSLFTLCGDTVYYSEDSTTDKASTIYSFIPKEEKTKQAAKINDRVKFISSTDNSIYVATKSEIWSISKNEDSVPVMYYDFSDMPGEHEKLEIGGIYISKNGQEDCIFLIARRYQNGNYSWNIYGKLL